MKVFRGLAKCTWLGQTAALHVVSRSLFFRAGRQADDKKMLPFPPIYYGQMAYS